MSTGSMNEIWVYLSAQPLLWLALTLAVYLLAMALHRSSGGHPAVNPVLLSVSLLVALLLVTDTPYQRYFDGAQFVHFLLGPATVALAIPLHGQLKRLLAMSGPLLIALVVGSLTAGLSAYAIGALLGASGPTVASLAPKSVTTPIAMGIAERLGGLASLTAVFVILTGIFGAVFAAGLLKRIGVKDDASIGFAMGLASHGIGTARAFQINEQTGAFAALAMGLNGLLTAIALPWLLPLLAPLLR
ncbi:LrgB family protein [Zoogloea sp.]|uniref:LrgB family protein n=1 Tax=Zoogloea sp. TaxID=49181 RepID=UPI0026364412|nr:LrgB family protein [Zoogloea sp.]MDD3354797.1 LrgB family protein [Zoogloea sp.]